MHYRERSEAPVQHPEQPASAALTQDPEQILAQLAHLAAIGQSVKQAWRTQLKLTQQIATAEWQLSGRSLTLAAALVVCFGAGLILLWGSSLMLLGYLLFQLSSSILVTALALVLLQSGLLLWCWRSLGYLLSQVGFSKTLAQLGLLFFAAKPEEQHADTKTR